VNAHTALSAHTSFQIVILSTHSTDKTGTPVVIGTQWLPIKTLDSAIQMDFGVEIHKRAIRAGYKENR
jgi:hypothetical protein